MTEEIKSAEQEFEVTEPIIINMGKQKRKRIKRLLSGRGKLWGEVEGVIEEVGTQLGEDLEGKTIVPLILVYRRRPKRRRARGLLGI
jgi:hypothetical protein